MPRGVEPAGPAVAGLRRWLLLIYQVPPEPSSARSAIWRETRRLGALPLQHGVCMLLAGEENRAAFDRVRQRAEGYGGEASILETVSPDEAWEARAVARFNAARDEEYLEVVDEAERCREEIDRERRKGKFTFAELEDEESNLERLRKYLAQVQARDCFGAEEYTHAAAEVERCAGELEVFSQQIYERQAPAGESELLPPAVLVRRRSAKASEDASSP